MKTTTTSTTNVREALQRLQAARCVERRGGAGDVVLLRETWGDSDETVLRGFLDVPDVRSVYRQVQRQMRAGEPAAA